MADPNFGIPKPGEDIAYNTQSTISHVCCRYPGYLKGMGVSAMIYLGDKLGFYQALDGAGLVTSAELAQKTRLHERWVREWIRGQRVRDNRLQRR